MSWALPAGFASQTRWGGTLIVRDGALASLPQDGASLRDSFMHRPGLRRLLGRGEALCVPAADAGPQGPRLVLRHMVRGGLVGPWLGDLYLSLPGRSPRMLEELHVSERARALGIETPQILAVFVGFSVGPLYRGDVVTREVPASVDLATWLVRETAPERRALGLAAAGRTIARAHARGLVHADLNARNILLAGSGDAPAAWLLDLDAARIAAPGEAMGSSARAQLCRLARSMRKIATREGRPLCDREEARGFLDAYARELGAGDEAERMDARAVTDGLALEFAPGKA